MTIHHRVLFISQSATRTGAPILLLHLMRWLQAKSDLELESVLAMDGPLRNSFAELGPITVLSQSGRPTSAWARMRRRLRFPERENSLLARLAKREDIGLVYSNTITNGRLLGALAPLRRPVISHVHELDYWIRRSGEDNLRLVKQHTAHYIAASDAVRRNLIDHHGIDEARISLVYESVPSTVAPTRSGVEIRASLGIPAGEPLVVGSGFEHWRKGKDLFVQLAAKVARRAGRRPYFVWVGNRGNDHEQYQLQHDIDRAGVASHVRFTGEVQNAIDYFAASDLFVLMSREDPFPLVCLEAASVGKPILCFSDAGGMPEFVEDDAGIVLPYLDVEAMAEAVIALIADNERRERLGRRGAEKVTRHYSTDQMAPKILGIIEGHLQATH